LITSEAVFTGANKTDANTKENKICEADLLTGELALRRGPKDEAVRLFRLAAVDCRKNINARGDASVELKALDVKP
jgi:hypothetical protein